MVFSGIPFLFFFLPALMLLYFLVPEKAKNTVLLIFSLAFYAAGEPSYIILMIFSITQAYIFGRLMATGKRRKLWFILTLICAVAPLVVCKYADFIVENVNLIPGVALPLPGIPLPIGISFYTFQLIGYAADVYMGQCEAQKNPFTLALYVSLFPQLIAGPIVRYSDVEKALTSRKHTLEGFTRGILRFSVGLGKKILIANTLGELVGALGHSMLGAWIGAIAAALQFYFDFSGYSDMAIGLGRMFGFEFMENFNYPFISAGVAEFWRRWHISLGSWFRDYIYIPMGGNRVSLPRWIFNILVVWMFTGLWHGAQWNFVLWGLYFAFFLVLEKFMRPVIQKTPKVIRHVVTLLVVLISFVLFNSNTLADFGRTVASMFDFTNPVDTTSLYYARSYAVTLLAAAVGATPLLRNLTRKLADGERTKNIVLVLSPLFAMIVLVLSTAYVVDGSFNPFLYFRF